MKKMPLPIGQICRILLVRTHLGPFVSEFLAESEYGRVSTHFQRQLICIFKTASQGIPLNIDESLNWRYTRNLKDHPAFKEAHSYLSQLYGYLENQSLSSNTSTRRTPAKSNPTQQPQT